LQLEKANPNPCYPYLLPKSYRDCKSYAPFIKDANKHNVTCQVLRSVSSWSAGFLDSDTTEQSIQEAYIQAISKAERYDQFIVHSIVICYLYSHYILLILQIHIHRKSIFHNTRLHGEGWREESHW